MKLLTLEKRNREVLAIMEDDGPGNCCPVLAFLKSQPKERSGSAKGFRVLFRRYAESGRAGLNDDLYHEVDKPEKIWEFIKGSLRVFCFEDEGGIVILSHGAIKKGQKVDRREVAKAIRNKRSYLAAKEAGQLEKVQKKQGD